MIALVCIVSVLCLFSFDKVEFETDMMKMNYMSDELAQSEINLNKVSSASAKSIFLVSSGGDIEEALQNNESEIILSAHRLDPVIDAGSTLNSLSYSVQYDKTLSMEDNIQKIRENITPLFSKLFFKTLDNK